jgi:fucose permease
VPRSFTERPPAAAILACLGFVLIGWSGLLVPSLIRSIKLEYAQTDAGIGLLYFLGAAAYIGGSLGGGLFTEKVGRRLVLALGAFCLGVGLTAFALAGSWELFLLASIPVGLGSGTIDGGMNGLVLDLYPQARGRALNLLHLFFSLGALGAPLAVGRLVEAGVPWQAVVLATGLVALPLAGLIALARQPSGRHGAADRETGARLGFAPLLLALALAIALYVASEIGVSNWLVRFLEAAPLSLATTALSLFWAGLTIGRLISARFSDRFDHVRFAMLSTMVASVALVLAVIVPSLPASIALFAIVGFAFGPVYPLIIAIGGERFPGRSAAVSGSLAGSAVVGGLIYPPIMGFMSVTVGLPIAMLGTAGLGLACALVLFVVGRSTRQRPFDIVARQAPGG